MARLLDTTTASEILGITSHRVKQIIEERNIPCEKGPGKFSRVKIPNESFRKMLLLRGFDYERNIVTIGQEKGGVGKSLLTFNIAVNMARRGAKVLIIDLDPEACLTNLMIKPKDESGKFATVFEALKYNTPFRDIIEPTRYEGIDIVGCKGVARRVERVIADQNPKKLLKSKMDGLEKYDLILFDVPPTFSRLISAAYLTSDIVIMPTFPDAWSIESIQLTVDDIKEDCAEFECEVPDLKILMNKFLADRKASRDAWSTLSRDFSEYLLPYQIKESAALQNFVNDGHSIFENAGHAEIKGAINNVCSIICPLIKKTEVNQ